jgi:hypothetical protein
MVPGSSQNQLSDDDPVWVEYLSVASIEDARLIDGWTKITDVTIVYVSSCLSFQCQEIVYHRHIGGTLQWRFSRIHRSNFTRFPT